MTEGQWIPSTETGDIEIEPQEWRSFLESFSRQHRGWHVHIEKQTLAGGLIDVEDQPLKRVTIDRANKPRADIVLGGHERSVIESIDEPALIVFKRSPDGAHEGVDITSKDGAVTTIRFHAAAFPETLDGIAA